MISIGFTGDVMIGRLLDEVISNQGTLYPWGNTLTLLKQNDVNVINLESTLTHCQKRVHKVFNFRAEPDKVQVLQEANIHIANLANNHILDFTEQGLHETIEVLHKTGIMTCGAGKNSIEARKPAIYKIQDITLGVIGYTDNEPSWIAGANKPGVNYIEIGDADKIKKDLAPFKDLVDFVIVSIHWGPNNREIPAQKFVDFAHEMVDMGVDIIHGHSAHVTQGVEVYKNKLIMYDTGDFVDDYAVGPLRNDYSCLFKVLINKEGIQALRLIPVLIDNFQVNLAVGHDFTQIVNRMEKLSKMFGVAFNRTSDGLELSIGK